jgi:hypothetical protein
VRAKNHLPEIAEDGGFSWSDAVLGNAEEDFAEHAIDVFGGVEIPRGCGEFGGEGLVGGRLGSGLGDVDEAVVWIGGADGLGAAASGRREMGAASMSEITNRIE